MLAAEELERRSTLIPELEADFWEEKCSVTGTEGS